MGNGHENTDAAQDCRASGKTILHMNSPHMRCRLKTKPSTDPEDETLDAILKDTVIVPAY